MRVQLALSNQPLTWYASRGSRNSILLDAHDCVPPPAPQLRRLPLLVLRQSYPRGYPPVLVVTDTQLTHVVPPETEQTRLARLQPRQRDGVSASA